MYICLYVCMYVSMHYKSKTELFLGFTSKPEVYAQNPRFSKTSIFPSLLVVLNSVLQQVRADAVLFVAKLTVLRQTRP